MDPEEIVPTFGHMPVNAIASWAAVLGIAALIVCFYQRVTFGRNVRAHVLINTTFLGIVGGVGLLHQRSPHDIPVFVFMELGALGTTVICFYYAVRLTSKVTPEWKRASSQALNHRPNRYTRAKSRFWSYYLGLGSFAAMLVPAPFEGHFLRWIQGLFALIVIGVALYWLGIATRFVHGHYKEYKEAEKQQQQS